QMLSKSTDGTLVKTDEQNNIIGWSSFGPSRDDDGADKGELYAIYLLSDYWGMGYGRSLMKSSESLIIDMGFSTITLWVLELNIRTRRFYEKSGYQHDKTEKQIEIGGVLLNELRYKKTI
ncbi:MAG: GNAT family N-acetyltransferase, partial [Pyrinomonadaceae bacterium]|nr:GNAT family N-acetyltransferase [Pyrinomonadaceae bacterium]